MDSQYITRDEFNAFDRQIRNLITSMESRLKKFLVYAIFLMLLGLMIIQFTLFTGVLNRIETQIKDVKKEIETMNYEKENKLLHMATNDLDN